MTTTERKSGIGLVDKLNDCLSNSIAISDLLINADDVADETIPEIGSMLNVRLLRLKEIIDEQRERTSRPASER